VSPTLLTGLVASLRPSLLPPVGGHLQGEATEWTRKWFLKSTLLAACGGPSLRQGGGGEEMPQARVGVSPVGREKQRSHIKSILGTSCSLSSLWAIAHGTSAAHPFACGSFTAFSFWMSR